MKIITNKKGMTLLELIVYLVIAACVLAPIILLMHNSSINMTRDSVNADLRITGRDILNIIHDDLRNTGFKLNDPSGNMRAFESDVLINAEPNPGEFEDSSSIVPFDGDPHDALTIYKGVLSSNGTSWLGYDIIHYSVNGMELIREMDSVRTNGDVSDEPLETVIARNVESLQFQYSADAATWVNADRVLPEGDPVSNATGNISARNVRFIKVFVVLRDDKKVGALKNTPSMDVANIMLPVEDAPILRERFEMVVPIPNNGLIPNAETPTP